MSKRHVCFIIFSVYHTFLFYFCVIFFKFKKKLHYIIMFLKFVSPDCITLLFPRRKWNECIFKAKCISLLYILSFVFPKGNVLRIMLDKMCIRTTKSRKRFCAAACIKKRERRVHMINAIKERGDPCIGDGESACESAVSLKKLASD